MTTKQRDTFGILHAIGWKLIDVDKMLIRFEEGDFVALGHISPEGILEDISRVEGDKTYYSS